MTEVATILRSARHTLLADTLGVMAIAGMTLGLLHLPGLL